MTNAERAILTGGIVVVGMVGLYLVRKWRANDVVWSRDIALMVRPVAVLVAVAVLLAWSEFGFQVAVPVVLVLAGLYLLREGQPARLRRLGWLSIALGMLAALQFLLRLLVIR